MRFCKKKYILIRICEMATPTTSDGRVIPTFQSFPSFGRVYAAYGGVFIVLAVLWGWLVDKKTPDMYDWLGAAICLLGVSVMLWAPRQ